MAVTQRKKPATNIRLTDRDREVIHQVSLHRFMTADQIKMAVAPSFLGSTGAQWNDINLRKRLKLLFDHKYLHRPKEQPQFSQYKEGGGSFPLVYSLGSAGAAEMRRDPEQYHIGDLGKFSVNRDNKVSSPHINHTIMTTDITVRMMRSCFEHNLIFRDQSVLIQALAMPGRTTLPNGTRGWPVTAHPPLVPEDSGVIPDRMCCIEIPDIANAGNLLFFFLEADTGEEPIKSENFVRATPEKKIRLYRSTAKRRLLQEHFPLIERFLVLLVTSSPERARTIVSHCQAIDGGWKRILITDVETLKKGPFLSVPWLEGKDGTTITIEEILKHHLRACVEGKA